MTNRGRPGPRSSPPPGRQTKGVPPSSGSGPRAQRGVARPRGGPRRRGASRRSAAACTAAPAGPGGRRLPPPPPARGELQLPACSGGRGGGARAPRLALPAGSALPPRGGRHVPMRSANGGGAGRVTCHCLALLCAAGRAGAECDRSGGAGRWVRGGAGAAGLPGRGWPSVRGPSRAEKEGGGPRRVRRSVRWAVVPQRTGLEGGCQGERGHWGVCSRLAGVGEGAPRLSFLSLLAGVASPPAFQALR